MPPLRLWSESLTALRTSPVLSVLVTIITCVCAILINVTSGQSEAAREEIQASLFAAPARTTVINSEIPQTIERSALNAVAARSDIELMLALGPASDMTPTVTAGGGAPLAVREAMVMSKGSNLINVPENHGSGVLLPHNRLATDGTFPYLSYESENGSIPVVGSYQARTDELEYVRNLGLKVTSAAHEPATMNVRAVVIVARPGANLAQHETEFLTLFGNKRGVQVRGSAETYRKALAVSGSLTSHSAMLLTGVFAGTGILVFALMSAWALLSQRDVGRRRVLGATRSDILLLTLTQVALLGTAGNLIALALIQLLSLTGWVHAPPFGFRIAIGWLCVGVTIIAALVPTIAMSRTDPVRVLRQA